jgi:branched-chain amino acid transport system permease protein
VSNKSSFTVKNAVFGIFLIIGLVAVPHFLKLYHQDLLIFLTINVLVVCSYRIVTLTGEWSLIHAVMMGVGAYTVSLLVIHFDAAIWLTLPMAGIVAALVAALLCFPLLRMTQFYFLIGSFAAGEAIRLTWVYYVGLFGGTSGLRGVEAPIVWGIDFLDPIPYYYFTLCVVGFCLFILYRIEKSRIGLTLHAIHWKVALAESVGVNAWSYRALAFIAGSFFVGIAGALKVTYLGSVTPNQFTIGYMIFILIWVIVGGYNKFYGPIIGVIVLSVFDESIRSFEIIRPAIYGAMLILSILFLPLGLESIPAKIKSWFGAGSSPKEPPLSDQ